MQSVDAQARPENMELSINGKIAKTYQNTSNAAEFEIEHPIYVNATYEIQSKDFVGNKSEVKSIRVDFLDRDAPEIASVSMDSLAYAKSHLVTVLAKDSGCGLHDKAYRIAGGEWQREAQFEITANGIVLFEVRDALGNIARQAYEVNSIDVLPPSIQTDLIASGKTVWVGSVFYTNEVQIDSKVIDIGSGMQEFFGVLKTPKADETKWPGTDINENESVLRLLIQEESECYLYAVDNANNDCYEYIDLQMIDTTGPNITYEIKHESAVENNQKTWTNGTYVTIKTSDMKSRPKRIICRKDGQIMSVFDNKEQSVCYEETFLITENGSYVIYAEDA